MVLNYLDEKKWHEITREERYFCAELYRYIKTNKKEGEFVNFIDGKSAVRGNEG